MRNRYQIWLPALLVCLIPALARAQATPAVEQGGGTFRVQCPVATVRHPGGTNTGGSGTVVNPAPDQADASYTGPVSRTATLSPALDANGNQINLGGTLTFIDNGGAIRCQQISGGDGYMTEADGNQTFMFSFGPLSGLNAIENNQPGTQFPIHFNNPYCDPARPTYNNSQPNPYCAAGVGDPNGAVGYVGAPTDSGMVTVSGGTTVTFVSGTNSISGTESQFPTWLGAGGTITINGVAYTISTVTGSTTLTLTTSAPNGTFNYSSAAPAAANVGTDVAAIMNTGVMNGNIPGPLMAFNEDDEFILNLSNVGMIMRPDLFEQHTVHFHGYPNASSFYDGVPDATWAVNIGATASYYYFAPDAGTYFWHCHITPPEHIQMGMEGWLYVRPRQNRVPVGTNLFYTMNGTGTITSHGTFGTATGLSQQSDLRTACFTARDILCSAPGPAVNNLIAQGTYTATDPAGRPDPQGYLSGDNYKYVYNDGDASTRYDIDIPLNMHGFDPNFHFVGMTFNPEGFADMKDKYFLLNGRSYPDTSGVPQGYLGTSSTYWTGGVTSNGNPLADNAITTAGSDGQSRPSQPYPSLVVLYNGSATPLGTPTTCGVSGTSQCGQRAALRINNLSVTEYLTLSSIGFPMTMVGFNAKILRDQAGNNLYVKSNSITIGGGESCDVVIDSTGVAPGTYFLYTPQLDHLSNDAENFGGLMTEVVILP